MGDMDNTNQRRRRITNQILGAITKSSDRDQQKSVGPSEIAGRCDHCLGKALTRKYPELDWEEPDFAPERFSLKAWIGTAVHEKLERDHTHGVHEATVHIADLDGYGSITGHCDLFVDRTVIDYKGLPLDTEIPTPQGWTTIGLLNVGDEVFDMHGQRTKVTQKSSVHQRKCYRVTFDDTSEVVCDDEHLWHVVSGAKHKEQVLNTEQIKETLRQYGQRQHRVPVAGALELPDAELPVDPYVLGCWLGDGNKAEGNISKPDDDLFRLIEERGYKVGPHLGKDTGKVRARTVYGLRTQLRLAGLLGNKHVPEVFLRASQSQRLALFQGLMDTDGSWNKTRSQALFCTTDPGLARSAHELAASLGQRPLTSEVVQNGFGLTVTAYWVSFKPVNGLNPFRLPRKRDLVSVKSQARSKYRIIQSVEEVPPVQTQCIAVDSITETYLCTKNMIPTHNTKDMRVLDGIKLNGPPKQEVFQINLYALGFVNAGEQVSDVGLVYIPRDSNRVDDVHPVFGKYNPKIADRALSRLKSVWEHVQQGKGELLSTDKDCFPCKMKWNMW